MWDKYFTNFVSPFVNLFDLSQYPEQPFRWVKKLCFKSKILSFYSFPFQKNHLKVSISSSHVCLLSGRVVSGLCYDIQGRSAANHRPGPAARDQSEASIMRRVRISHETRPVSGDSVMMGVIMQKCDDDTHPVVTDDRTILPSERGCRLLPLALNRIITHFGFTFKSCNKCPCLRSHYLPTSGWPHPGQGGDAGPL